MRTILILLAAFSFTFCNGLNFTKMKECEFDPDKAEFNTICSEEQAVNTKFVMEIDDKLARLYMFSEEETYALFECYDEDGYHICNGANSSKDEIVIFIKFDSVVIIEPEFKSLVLF